jgi:hypothetical protein
MSEGIIEILQNVMTDGECAYFEADKDVDSVELSVLGGDASGILSNIAGHNVFQYGENYVVLSIGCILPLSFQFWDVDDSARTGFTFWVNEKGTTIKNLQSRLNHIWIPFGSYEMSLGMYFPGHGYTDPLIDDDFQLRARFFDKGDLGNFPHISMLNLPESLDEQKFYVPVFIKVLHTYPLTSLPS